MSDGASTLRWTIPTLADVLEARDAIAPYLQRTPLHAYAGLSRARRRRDARQAREPPADRRVQGARRASTSSRQLDAGRAGARRHHRLDRQPRPVDRVRGAAASACPPRSACPSGANPAKLASMRALGAEIVEHGRDFDEAREHCERLADEHGLPLRPLGQRAAPDRRRRRPHTLEILEQEPGVDAIVVPIGGGSGAAGACIAAEGDQPGVRGDRRPVGGGAGRLPLLAGARGFVEDRMGTRRRGPRDPDRLRAAPADSLGAARRLRARRARTRSATRRG